MVVLTEEESLKTDVLDAVEVCCALCGCAAAPDAVVAASIYADGAQAFGCTIHLLRDRRRWIVFWAAFEQEERRVAKLLRSLR